MESKKIEELIYSQYLKFNHLKGNKIQNNFIDELINTKILIYNNLNEDSLKIKEIYNIENIKENINWEIENSLKIPYINNNKIKAIKFSDNNLNLISSYLS